MAMPLCMTRIQKSHDLQNDLELLYDFALMKPTEETSKQGFNVNVPALCIGRDACGGVFALVGEGDEATRRVAYISSEGQAGIVAETFDAFMSLVVTMPFWLDVLKFSGGGNVDEMEKACKLLSRDVVEDMDDMLEDDDDERDYRTVQKQMMKRLEVKEMTDPVRYLHRCVASGNDVEFSSSKDGTPYEFLFNRFVTTDNPMWKNANQPKGKGGRR